MRRPLALRAEILDRLDDAGAEIHLPEAIHGDARQQRIAADRPATRAKPSRLFGAPAGSGGRTAGTPAYTFSPG